MKTYIYSLNDIPEIVEQLKKDIKEKGCNILALSGPLGAGKTTLIRELVSSMGVSEDEIVSPTFNYVNVYAPFARPPLSAEASGEGWELVEGSSQKIFHFDLYRISCADEFLQAGFDEYLNSGDMVLIEWPEVIKPLLKDKKVCWIAIDYEGDDKRKLVIN